MAYNSRRYGYLVQNHIASQRVWPYGPMPKVNRFLCRILNGELRGKNAALFSEKSENRREVIFYFSPEAARIARFLTDKYGAIPCQKPVRANVIPEAGDEIAFQSLWPAHHND
jgi:hypothetical protein